MPNCRSQSIPAPHARCMVEQHRFLFFELTFITVKFYIFAFSLVSGNMHLFYCPHNCADTPKLPFYFRRGGRRPR